MTVRYEPAIDRFQIMINDLPHVILIKKEFLATRAYAEPPSELLATSKQYCIEFIMKGNSFTCKYADRELWAQVLEILNKHI